MKLFTKEMLKKLTEANEKVKGTTEYLKFYMENDSRNQRGRWLFCGHHIPHTTGIITTFKDNTYIVTYDEFMGEQRYHVNDEVKNLLGI